MSKLSTLTPIAAMLALTVAGTSHAANPFAAKPVNSIVVAEAAEGHCGADKGKAEGKCGASKGGEMKAKKEGKCGEGKCGANKKKMAEGKCGADKGKAEGKCGANKGSAMATSGS